MIDPCGCLYNPLPSRDKASRIFLHAVARSEIDCHSSSDESAVSERTETQQIHLSIIRYRQIKQTHE